MEESIQKIVRENQDSLEIGTPGRGGALKIYFDADKVEEAKKKVLNAEEVRKFAQANIMI